jgi:hypothetical protein
LGRALPCEQDQGQCQSDRSRMKYNFAIHVGGGLIFRTVKFPLAARYRRRQGSAVSVHGKSQTPVFP